MGALLAGVFCGVLLQVSIFFFFFLLLIRVEKIKLGNPYGATGKSAFLFLMGSDMMNGGNEKGVGENEVRREKKEEFDNPSSFGGRESGRWWDP